MTYTPHEFIAKTRIITIVVVAVKTGDGDRSESDASELRLKRTTIIMFLCNHYRYTRSVHGDYTRSLITNKVITIVIRTMGGATVRREGVILGKEKRSSETSTTRTRGPTPPRPQNRRQKNVEKLVCLAGNAPDTVCSDTHTHTQT